MNKLFKVVTPFGVGFATSEEDLKNMNMFIAGAKAVFGLMEQYLHVEDPEESICETVPKKTVEHDGPKHFSSRKELEKAILPYLLSQNLTLYTDSRKDGTRRIKFTSGISDHCLDEARKTFVGATYQDSKKKLYRVCEVGRTTAFREFFINLEPVQE